MNEAATTTTTTTTTTAMFFLSLYLFVDVVKQRKILIFVCNKGID